MHEISLVLAVHFVIDHQTSEWQVGHTRVKEVIYIYSENHASSQVRFRQCRVAHKFFIHKADQYIGDCAGGQVIEGRIYEWPVG